MTIRSDLRFPSSRRLPGLRAPATWARSARRSPLFWITLAGFLSFAVAWALFSWSIHGGKRVLVVDATFSSTACCSMQIWLNAAASREDSIDLPIQAGTLASYAFPMNKTLIDRIRLKLGDNPGSWVVIHRIYIRQGSKVISQLPAAALTQFVGYSAVSDPSHGPSAYRLEQRQAMLDESNILLRAGAGPVRVAIARIVHAPTNFFSGFIVFGSALIAVVGTLRRRLLLLVALATSLGTVYALPSLLHYLDLSNDVSQAVSFCAFIGVSKPRERYMVVIAAILAFLIPATVGWLQHRRGRGETNREHADGTQTVDQTAKWWSSRWTALGANAVPLGVIGLLYAPDLKVQLAAARTQTWADSWDQNNFLMWDYLVHRGLVPIKDFFYPYGMQYLLTIDLPWGSLIRFVAFISFWTYTVVGSWALLARFFSGRGLVLRHLVLMAFLVTFALSGFDLGARYAAPLGAVLLFCSLRPTDGLLDWKRILFCISLVQLTLFEVAQAVYALGPIAFLFVVELALSLPREGARHTLPWAVRAAATVVTPLAVATVVLAATAQLGGVVFFYRQLSALASAYAYPAPVSFWVTHPHNLSSFVFWAFPITLALGAFGLFAFRGDQQAVHARVIAVGLVGFMIMQRQVIRDGAETGMWVTAVYGLLIWGVVESSRARTRHASAVAALFGTVAALALASGAYTAGWKNLKAGPSRVSDSVAALANRAEFAAVEKTRWGPSRFTTYNEWPVVRAVTSEPVVKAGGRIWVLGDAGAVILLSHERWPYYFASFYDGSPIAYQQKTLSQLQEMPPARVLFNFAPGQMIFDDVPNIVRVPLLFTWAIDHLEPQRTIGNWAILRPRLPGEPIALAWWRRRLGTTIDLGLIPQDIRPGNELCVSGPNCRTYLVVTPTAGVPMPTSFIIPVEVGGLQFYVRLETDPAVHRYVVDLSRAWFWAAPPPQASRSVTASQISGATVQVIERLQSSDVLY